MRSGKPYLVPAVKRAFETIELLASRKSSLTISDIHRELRLPLSSVATILYTLDHLGYVERDEHTFHYRLSVKLFGVARRALDQVDLVAQCHDLLEAAVRESRMTGHLAVLREGESMYVDRVASDSLVQISTYVGSRWPAHTSAAGKTLLAFLPEPELQQTLRGMALKRLTPYTITKRTALLRQFASFRRRGYCWERNEGELGLGCVGAPVYGPHGDVVAALSLSGTVHQVSSANLPTLGCLAKHYADQMSARLGYSRL